MKFIYTVNPQAECPIMLLTDDIGIDPETGKGIDGARFLNELLALEAMKPKCIEVWINSAGGIVAEGYNIYSAILDSKVPVDTKCVGMAASISAVIFEAGRNRVMNDYAWLMFHNPYGGDDKKLLEVMKASIGKMIARCGKLEEEIMEMMKRTTYIYADEAVKLGLADRVDASDQKNKKRLTQLAQQPHAFHREVNLIVNTLFKTSEMSLKLITNKLGLSADASEDSILQAIIAIQNKAGEEKIGLEGEIANLEKKIKKYQDELDKLKKERADMDDEMDCIKKDKAKNAIMEYTKIGRIKNEAKVIDFWVARYLANPDEAKAQLDALPLNKMAPVIENTGQKTGVRYTAGAVMAQINAKRKN